MKVFCDLHHIDLYYSLHLLFEKRLGWELYYPIGEDWFTQGYWKIAEPYNNDAGTIRQFLNPEALGFDQYKSINGKNHYKDGIYYCYDPIQDYERKAITLEKFKEMDIDIVISSYQPHDATFAQLIKDFKPKAKHIAQMGNAYQTTEVDNVMCSTLPYPTPAGKNVVFYHQEFDLEKMKYEPPVGERRVTSFVNCLPNKEMYDIYKSALPDLEFKAYGASCPDGTITGIGKIGDIMRESMFGWHIKPGGDGFGHVIHNWFACGRPVLTNFSDYQDKLAGALLQDGKTALNLEACGFNENINRILYYSLPQNHKEMCQNVYNRFKEIVNFDNEEIEIRKFLGKII